MAVKTQDAVGQLALIHLVWAPLGLDPLRKFARAYTEHHAGVPHRLIVVYNGFAPGQDRAAWEAILGPLVHDELVLGRAVQDVVAYIQAVSQTTADTYCFLNSYSEPLVDGWLGLLTGHLRDPKVVLVGATGSHESFYTSAHWWARPLRRNFPAFPNAHLRTNAFAVRRVDLSRIRWPHVSSKARAWRFESGKDGLTRQCQRFGEVLVAGRDGRGYAWREWPTSRTFRSGLQDNLLVADNRTRQYESGDPAERAALALRAWGAA